jgi:hypothetical protein
LHRVRCRFESDRLHLLFRRQLRAAQGVAILDFSGSGSSSAGSRSARRRIASVVSTASTRPLYGRGAGSTPAGGSSYARSSTDRALPREPEARRAPTSRVRVRVLAGLPLARRRGPERLGYLVGRATPSGALWFEATRRSHPTTATFFILLRAGVVPVIDPNRQVAGSSPARSTSGSGSSAGRAVKRRAAHHDRSSCPAPRAGEDPVLAPTTEHREAANLHPAMAGSPTPGFTPRPRCSCRQP